MRWHSIHMSLRFIVPLVVVLALFAYAVVPFMESMPERWFVRDLDARSQLVANAMQDPLLEYIPQNSGKRVEQLFERALHDERLYALAFCSPGGRVMYKTETYPDSLGCRMVRNPGEKLTPVVRLPQGAVHVWESPLFDAEQYLGKMVLVHDMSFIERRSEDTRKYLILLFIGLGIVVSMIAVLIAWLSLRDWIKAVRGLVQGDFTPQEQAMVPREVQPLISDLRELMQDYRGVYHGVGEVSLSWTPEKLRDLLHDELAGDEILVVSNREPYIHMHTEHGIEVQRPASGLVTAVEPVMRACSGTWIAHGAGSADRETTDGNDRVQVPPRKPAYTLRRVWLSEEEEQGYYYGFANEGLWPLCHIAHVRPVFRSTDWEHYVEVNQRFADTVVAEARTDDPVVLVQDYHFALLPRMVKEKLPKATIIMFWHIPWPNPESFGICPWREEILEGLLGNTILGFHTPFHCKNFLETVDRYLETRIEYEASTVSYGGELTQVESYPISIAWPDMEGLPPVPEERLAIRTELGLPPEHLLAVGVDRLDYTKGIVERLQAVERMLELYPEMIGRFSLVQIAAPSRSSLEEYQHFEARVRRLAARINDKYSSGANGGFAPVLLRIAHHDSEQVTRYYRAADVCVVTSLHDGMNLVAKEFIAARDDERGVLILSQFTGAARELVEALIVNPYHIEQGAQALYRALTMPEIEQRERMRSMRTLVRDYNVYRWAGRMLLDAAQLRRQQRVIAKIRSHSAKPFRRAR